MTIVSPDTIKSTIELILLGKDHRSITDILITKTFLAETIEFFKEVITAKLNTNTINMEWYRDRFIDNEDDKAILASRAGLSVKTVSNLRGTARREVVIEESHNNFDSVLQTVNDLCDTELEIDLSIKFNDVSVTLTLSESLVVINALAVRRNQIRAGAWSSLGKRVEAPLLETMCRLFQVPDANYERGNRNEIREIDFCLINRAGETKKCEIKLMGRGNPEGADVTFARDSSVFIASELSDTNITQLDNQCVEWVQLRGDFEFIRFGTVLENLDVPYEDLPQDADLPELIKQAVAQIEV